ncbi:hypothetical protein PCC7418_0407 [Halothece sp. PCC 7418]|uniref:DUF6391 domain-containing protein n=1 Tax=Halothece sp. (strain PCC 7418) TaxID=65093 RepID=UPI0002A05B45|nr:DUF6391 domain-containing protein [Halothece sp. PCC 7418]AFZ42641.1 hypothetical protein PCC7418_0407 [Halothece sp. PCC 7418]
MMTDTATEFFTPAGDSDLLQQLSFVPGLKEILMLRQVHALEHATVWILSENAPSSRQKTQFSPTRTDNETLGGLSTEKGFYLYGEVPARQLQRGVLSALHRFRAGEWDLAVHPRCGTNVSVALLLTAGLTLSSHVLLPKDPISQLLGMGLGMSVASSVAPEVGQWAQKYVTTAIPFNLELERIYQTTDLWGRSANFVQLGWRNLQ